MFLLAVIVLGLKENNVNPNRNYAHWWLYIVSESCDKIHNIRNDDLPFMWTFAPPRDTRPSVPNPSPEP